MSLPASAPPRVSDMDWRWALPRIALVFIVTRLLVLAVAVAVETTQVPPEGVRIDQRPIIGSLTAWDGTYYVGIAETGYHADPDYGPDYAFFPGYSITVRTLSLLTGGDMPIAALLAANLAFALALVVLYALSVRNLDPRRAILGLWFIALAPGSIAYTLAYSDSLFLLLTVAAFLAMELRRVWLAGIALALAALTRVPGILLLLPMVLLLVEQEGWRPTRRWLPFLLAPLVVAGIYGYFWWLTGDPLAALQVQSFWRADEVVDAAGVATGDLDYTKGHSNESLTLVEAPQWVVAYYVGALAFYAFLLVFFRHDRIRPAYTLVAVLGLVTVFVSGTLQSGPRYLAVVWPFHWVLANRRSRLGKGLVLGGFALGQVVLLWLAFTWVLVP